MITEIGDISKITEIENIDTDLENLDLDILLIIQGI